MRALIQRVSEARVTVNGECVGEIDRGLLVLLAVQRGDDESRARRMSEKLLAYRVFADEKGKMNCSVSDIGGALLVVSQFTLAADTDKGLRPSFSSAADPQQAGQLYEFVLRELDKSGLHIAAGQFAADMQVALINDGPVTFLLET